MNTLRIRLILAAVAALILIGLFVLLRPKSPAAAPVHRTFTITINGDAADPSSIKVNQNDTVTFNVSADSQFPLHLVGYDTMLDLKPHLIESETFKANRTGTFSLENADTRARLVTFTVQSH